MDHSIFLIWIIPKKIAYAKPVSGTQPFRLIIIIIIFVRGRDGLGHLTAATPGIH